MLWGIQSALSLRSISLSQWNHENPVSSLLESIFKKTKRPRYHVLVSPQSQKLRLVSWGVQSRGTNQVVYLHLGVRPCIFPIQPIHVGMHFPPDIFCVLTTVPVISKKVKANKWDIIYHSRLYKLLELQEVGTSWKCIWSQEGLRKKRSNIICILALLRKENLGVFQSQPSLFWDWYQGGWTYLLTDDLMI